MLSQIQRWALCLEYDGSPFYGWQRQRLGLACIQNFLEDALSKVAREPVKVTCAGRTDRGVHACRQFVHFDTAVSRSDTAWVLGSNRYLPAEIRVKWAKPVPREFNARRSARIRRYRYLLLTERVKSAHWHNHISWIPTHVDVKAMQEACVHLVGRHDFSAFRGNACQARSPVRSLYSFDIYLSGRIIVFDISANAFLHHMVRNFVGSLLLVGQAKKEPSWIQEVLVSKDRKCAGPTASPNGLYLVEVLYPDYDFPLEVLGPDLI
jgi:tRNA pseudouridine38-40 synthase